MDNFKWTDELVSEYSLASQHLTLVEFKRRKQPTKEYEVQCIVINDRQNYWLQKDGKYNCELFHPHSTLENLLAIDGKIYCVKRRIDGEVFTIGNKVKYGLACENKPIEWVIDNFFIPKDHKDILARSKDNQMVEFVGTLKKIEDKTSIITKPPMGLMPMQIHREKRLEEINKAIKRYIDANEGIPNEWIDERDGLIGLIKTIKLNK